MIIGMEVHLFIFFMPKNPLTLKDDSFGFSKTREADLDVVQIRPCATEKPSGFPGDTRYRYTIDTFSRW